MLRCGVLACPLLWYSGCARRHKPHARNRADVHPRSARTAARTVDATRSWNLLRQCCARRTGPSCDCARQVGKQTRDNTTAGSLRQAQVYRIVHGSTRRKHRRRNTWLKSPPPNLQAFPIQFVSLRAAGWSAAARPHIRMKLLPRSGVSNSARQHATQKMRTQNRTENAAAKLARCPQILGMIVQVEAQPRDHTHAHLFKLSAAFSRSLFP